MNIEIKIEPYCKGCPYFEPYAEKRGPEVLFHNDKPVEMTECTTEIFCENRELCQSMWKRLRKKNSGGVSFIDGHID